MSGLALRVSGLEVRGAGGRCLVDLPALDIAPGESLAITGASGAGKSTLLFALAGLQDRTKGEVQWGGTEILSLSAARRAAFRGRSIGMVFQDYLLFEELGAADNASLGSLFAPRSARAGIADRAARLLDRLAVPQQTRSVASFSGGERQRVAVARALASDPPVLLADEPTASLDRAAADRLAEDLAALARQDGKTLITVSHDPALIARMDRVLHLADGRIAERQDA